MKYLLNTPLAIHELGQRQNQEDSIYPAYGQADAGQRLFILCDGMGGHSHGEVASGIVCQEVSKFVQQVASPNRAFPDAMLTAAMESMYNVLDANDDGSGKTMGTTMVFVYFHPGGVMAAHVGDSRYYHIRPSTHEILYRSRDHSLVTELYEAGEIKLDEMATAKGKNVIMRAVMPNKEERAMPDIVHIKDVQPGDWFYMCSDGMLEQMSDEEILNIFSNEALTPEQKRDCLLAATEGNHDNHTAYLIRVEAVEHDAVDAAAPDDEQEARSRNKALLETFGLGPFAAASAATVQPCADDVQTTTFVEPATEGVVAEAVAPSDTESVSVEYTDSHDTAAGGPPVMPPASGNNNNRLYVVIGILVAAVVLLVVCLFVFRKDGTKTKNEPQPIKSVITAPEGSDDADIWGSDGGNASGSGTVTSPAKKGAATPTSGGGTGKSKLNKVRDAANGTGQSTTISGKMKDELVNDGNPQNGGTGISEEKTKREAANAAKEIGTKPVGNGTNNSTPGTGKDNKATGGNN